MAAPLARDRVHRNTWDRARFYRIEGRDLPSVTTILDIVAEPGLGPWYAQQERRWFEAAMLEVLAKPGARDPDVVLAAVVEAVSGLKAADRERQRAVTIGSAAHAGIEWHLRTALGEDAGSRRSFRTLYWIPVRGAEPLALVQLLAVSALGGELDVLGIEGDDVAGGVALDPPSREGERSLNADQGNYMRGTGRDEIQGDTLVLEGTSGSEPRNRNGEHSRSCCAGTASFSAARDTRRGRGRWSSCGSGDDVPRGRSDEVRRS